MTKCPQVIWKFYMTWSLQNIESVWSIRFGSSRFESTLFNSSRFESVQIEPLRVGLTALIEPNRTEWATSIPSCDAVIQNLLLQN